MKDNIFTSEAIKAIESEELQFKEDLKLEAINEAFNQRREVLEVTKNDVLKARKKFVKKQQELYPRTSLILKVYMIIGISMGVLGLLYPYIKMALNNANADMRIGAMISLFGILLIVISYLLRQVLVLRYKRINNRISYNELSIKNEMNRVEDIEELMKADNYDVKFSDIKEKNKFDLLAKISPKTVVLESWIMIEKAINNILSRCGSLFPENNTNTPLKMLEFILKNKYIDFDMFNKLNTMRILRNQIVHSSKDTHISTEEAIEYRLLSMTLIDKLGKLNPLKKVYVCYHADDEYAYRSLMDAWNSDNNKFMDIINSKQYNESGSIIKEKIDQRIKISDIVLLIIGKNTAESHFVQYELNIAEKYNKRIIGVKFSDTKEDMYSDYHNIIWVNSLSKDDLLKALY